MAADVDVVVLDEEQFSGEARVAKEPEHLLQHFFARRVPRMRLAGEDELNRALRVGKQAAQALEFVGDGVFLIDREGLVRLWNPAAERIAGLVEARR